MSGIVIKIIILRLNCDSFQMEVLNQGSRHVKKRADSHGVRARAVSVLRLDRMGRDDEVVGRVVGRLGGSSSNQRDMKLIVNSTNRVSTDM